MRWTYERMKADLSVEECPRNDYDGSVTGQVGKAVFNVPAWLDEHPEERKRLGWIKHMRPERDDLPEYNPQTQYIQYQTMQIDDYTVEDIPHVCDKSEEMLRYEEISRVNYREPLQIGGLTFFM